MGAGAVLGAAQSAVAQRQIKTNNNNSYVYYQKYLDKCKEIVLLVQAINVWSSFNLHEHQDL